MSDDYDWTPHLQDGEEVLWQGRPDGRYKLFLANTDYLHVPVFAFLMLPAGLMVFVFASGPASSFVFETVQLLMGFFMFLVVTFLAFGRAFLDQMRRRRYRYAVTSSRVLQSDAKTSRLLVDQPLSSDLSLELSQVGLPTLRMKKWFSDTASKADRILLDARPYFFIQSQKDNGAILNAVTRASILSMPNVNGYEEQGFELRMLADGKTVAKMIEDQIAKMKDATP